MHIILLKSKITGDGYISTFNDDISLVCKPCSQSDIDDFIKEHSRPNSPLCIQSLTPIGSESESYIVTERKGMNMNPIAETSGH